MYLFIYNSIIEHKHINILSKSKLLNNLIYTIIIHTYIHSYLDALPISILINDFNSLNTI